MDALPAPSFVAPQAIRTAKLAGVEHGVGFDVEICRSESIDAQDLLDALGARYHYPVARLTSDRVEDARAAALNYPECRRRGILACRVSGGVIVYFSDPTDLDMRAWAQDVLGAKVRWILVLESELHACLKLLDESASALSEAAPQTLATEAVRGTAVEELSLTELHKITNPVVRLVHSSIHDALGLGASDIHLEATASGLVVKYRIDGALSEATRIAGADFLDQVLSRVKVMAELDITERRVPQDGRFKLNYRGRLVDFRVSVMPNVFGEDAVVRILDKQSLSQQLSGFTLDHLGFDHATIATIRALATLPHGMLLVTGPTGSGKTTSLYAALAEINDGRDKIITIEDPVEYQLPGVLQIPVNERKGLSFGVGLRSILRHDPDKIMVGEIRDAETAQIAVQAALTGHLVFSTIHANNVFDVLGRFEHMGVDPYSFVSALNGIVAQRLVRMVCIHCAVDVEPTGREPLQTLRKGLGCKECRGTGYRGRRAIGESLVFDDELRELVATRAPIRTVRTAAIRAGTRLLRDAAEDLVRSGATTLDEINRVTFSR